MNFADLPKGNVRNKVVAVISPFNLYIDDS